MLRYLALWRYCQRVKSCLPCKPRQRRSILRQIRRRGLAWLAKNPSAPFTEFEQRFGTPEAIATSYVVHTEPEELLQKLRFRQILLLVLGCAVAVTLVISLVTWVQHIRWFRQEAEKGIGGPIKIIYEDGPVNGPSGDTLPPATGAVDIDE